MENQSFIKSSTLLIKARKEALGLWLWCSIVACLVVGRGFPPIQPSILSMASITLITISVYVYNDVVDNDADSNNEFKSNRPLATGDVPRSHAVSLIIVSALAGLGLSLLSNIMSFAFAAFYFVLFFLYSYPPVHLKKRFLVKETVISSGLVIVGMSVNYAILGTFSPMVLFGFMLFAVFAFVAMPTGFDSTDVDADRMQGVKTIASITTLQGRLQLAMGGMLGIMTLTPFTYTTFGYNVLLPISTALMGIAFIRLLYPLTRKFANNEEIPDEEIISTRKIILKFIFVICFCVILGSLNISQFLG